tara:strand:+ start:23582 stop:25759 length:2178 start_codon:yes stop_codon:yes gene_type:complete
MQENVTKFVRYYMSEIDSKLNDLNEKINLLEEKDQFEIERLTDITYDEIKRFRDNKDNIEEMLEMSNLPSDFIEKIEDNYEFINKGLKEIYHNNLPKTMRRKHFINTIFSDKKEVSLNKNVIEDYQEKLENYRTSEDLNVLFKNTFIFKDSSKSGNLIKQRLEHLFIGLETKDRAELISTLNVFYENYAVTDYGSKHLELLTKEYIKNKKEDPENAETIWIDQILQTVSESSPTQIYKRTGNKKSGGDYLYSKTNAGGEADGLLFINIASYTDKQKKVLSKIETLEDLKKFKKENNKISQVLICATSDKSINIEKDSVIRHPLGNLLLCSVLNQSLVEDPYLLDLFNESKGNKNLLNGNENIREAIVKSFEKTFPNVLDDKKGNLAKFNQIQNEILGDPIKYISIFLEKNANEINMFELNDHIKNKKNESITEEVGYKKMQNADLLTEKDFDMLMKIANINPIFKSESVLCLYRVSNVSKSRKIEDSDSIYKNIKELNLEEKESLFQYAALMKNHYLKNMDKKEMSPNLCNKFADSCVKLNVYSKSKDINAIKLREIKMDEIDCYVLETFLLGKNGKENLSFLDLKSQENISEILHFVVKNYEIDFLNGVENNFLSKNNINPEELSDKLKEAFKNNNKLISNTKKSGIESSINAIEKEREKCAEKKRADLLEEENIKVKAELEKKTKELEEKIKKELEEKMKKELEEYKEKITKQAIKTNNKNKQ